MKTLGDGESTGNTLWMCDQDIWLFVIFHKVINCYVMMPSQIFSPVGGTPKKIG